MEYPNATLMINDDVVCLVKDVIGFLGSKHKEARPQKDPGSFCPSVIHKSGEIHLFRAVGSLVDAQMTFLIASEDPPSYLALIKEHIDENEGSVHAIVDTIRIGSNDQ